MAFFCITLIVLILNGCSGNSTDEVVQNIGWFINQHKDLKNSYFVGKFGVDNNPSGWDTGAYLRAYIDAYEATHDIRILRNLDELLKIVADGNDAITKRVDDRTHKVMPGWGTREYNYGRNGGKRYSDMLTNALYAYPLAAFARIVKENPKLSDEFSADANRYYNMVQKLYDAHKPFVPDEYSPYSDGTYGAYFAYPNGYYENKNDYSGTEAPINMTVIIAEPLVEMYRASVADGKANLKYKNIVENVANYIWWNMHSKSTIRGDKYLTWYYWPADINYDSRDRMEDLTHGARLAEFVVSLYDAGLRKQWTKKKLEYLANTFTCAAVVNNTTFANYIDGTGGVYKDEPATLYEWLELQEYSHKSSRNTIAYYLKNSMKYKKENVKYNIAVFTKFIRYGQL